MSSGSVQLAVKDNVIRTLADEVAAAKARLAESARESEQLRGECERLRIQCLKLFHLLFR